VDAQLQAATAIRAAFNAAAANFSGLQLHLTGPGVFAVQSRQAIQDDARRLTVVAAIGVGLLLLLVLRSPRFLLWAAVPTATGALAGLAAVAMAFGSFHGITLGFGLTLIGEAVDYAIYVQVQRRGDVVPLSDSQNTVLWLDDQNAVLWRDDENAVLWRGLWLAVLTSGAGFVAMMLSGFAGLMQLGLMSIVGIAVAATVARFCLPDVLRPLEASQLARWEPLTRIAAFALRLRIAVWAVAAAAAVLLIARSDRLWNDELVAISPLARGAGEMDARLRSSAGLGDLRYVIAVEGATVDQALGRAEALHEPLRELRRRAAIAGFDSPATLVPSVAKQSERRAALPDETTLRARVAQAFAGSGLRAEAFAPFIGDVARAREQVINRDYYAGTALGQRLASQLIEGAQPAALITLTGVSDAAAVSAALRSSPGVSFVDLAAVQTLVADYRVRAAWAALSGGMLIVLILVAQLRNAKATTRIATAVTVSILITAAVLVLIEQRLTLFHLIALLLAAGVGSNYAVFIGMPRDRHNAASVVLSVMLAAATTLTAFAALAWSHTPVLHMIGITVAIGAPVSLLVAMAIAAPKAKQHA
jgi:predicted exporter